MRRAIDVLPVKDWSHGRQQLADGITLQLDLHSSVSPSRAFQIVAGRPKDSSQPTIGYDPACNGWRQFIGQVAYRLAAGA